MSRIAPDALRSEVLAAAGPHTDPRVVRIAREGTMVIEHDVCEWEASTGRIVAHRVRVGLAAELLGMLRGHPHIEDDFVRTVSAAIANRFGERASEILFHHDLGPKAALSLETPYRGSRAPSEPPALGAHVAWDLAAWVPAYLDAFGESELADVARRARFDVLGSGVAETAQRRERDPLTVRVSLTAEDAAATPSQDARLESCLRDLLGGIAAVRFVIR